MQYYLLYQQSHLYLISTEIHKSIAIGFNGKMILDSATHQNLLIFIIEDFSNLFPGRQ